MSRRVPSGRWAWLCWLLPHSYTFACPSVPDTELWACRRCNKYVVRGEVS